LPEQTNNDAANTTKTKQDNKSGENNQTERSNRDEAKRHPDAANASSSSTKVSTSGNFVFKRPKEEDPIASGSHAFVSPNPPITSGATYSHAPTVSQTSFNGNKSSTTVNTNSKSTSQNLIAQLGERQHAPGIRRPGCPCCDPENADNMIDGMMAL
jgi:hypothetical protein